MIKFHNLKKELPITEKRFFALVLHKSKYGNYCRYDTIEIVKYAPPFIGYRINFGDGCADYEIFCRDDSVDIYWFDIDCKRIVNSIFGIEENSSIIEQKGKHG